jgi:hypothetical protein
VTKLNNAKTLSMTQSSFVPVFKTRYDNKVRVILPKICDQSLVEENLIKRQQFLKDKELSI